MPKLKVKLLAELAVEVKPEWLQREDRTLSLQEFATECAESYTEDPYLLLEDANTQLTVNVSPVEE